MQGLAFKLTIVIVATLLSSLTFAAGTAAAGCMGCHQGGETLTLNETANNNQAHKDQKQKSPPDANDAQPHED